MDNLFDAVFGIGTRPEPSSDARYCSGACRQRAYRHRLAAAT
jgi:hypothetical protein